MDSPSPPPAPDPNVVAAAQGKANLDAARLTTQLNRPNQITPFGSLTWDSGPSTRTFDQSKYDAALEAARAGAGGGGGSTGAGALPWEPGWVHPDNSGQGGTPGGFVTGVGNPILPDRNDDQFWFDAPGDNWTSKITLDPKVQAIIDSQMATSLGLDGAIQNALGRVNSTMAQPLNFDADSLVADRQRIGDNLYEQHTRRLNPEFADRENAMRSTLMNRGFMEGTEAFERELQRFSMDRNDAFDVARRSAIGASSGEQDRQIANLLRGRNQVVNELASLRSGQQTQMPQFSSGMSGASVNPAPIANAMGQQYQGQLAAYNADVAGNNSLMGGLFALGGAALGAPSGSVFGKMFLG